MFKSFTTKLNLTQTDIEIHNPKKIQIRKLELRIFRIKPANFCIGKSKNFETFYLHNL